MILLLIGTAAARRIVPLKHVNFASAPAPDYGSTVSEIASALAAYVVDVIRGERAFAVDGAVIKAMKDQGGAAKSVTLQAAVEAAIE